MASSKYSNKQIKKLRRLLLDNEAHDINNLKKAFVIAIEGNKGSGKSNLLKGLVKWISDKKVERQTPYEPINLKESTYDLNADRRRDLQRRSSSDKYTEKQILHLITAGRSEMIRCPPVKDYLTEENNVILIDRYIGGTIAHQVAAGNQPIRVLDLMKDSYIRPDVIIRTKCPVDIAITRQLNRQRDLEPNATNTTKLTALDEGYNLFFRFVASNYNPLEINTHRPNLNFEESLDAVVREAILHCQKVQALKKRPNYF